MNVNRSESIKNIQIEITCYPLRVSCFYRARKINVYAVGAIKPKRVSLSLSRKVNRHLKLIKNMRTTAIGNWQLATARPTIHDPRQTISLNFNWYEQVTKDWRSIQLQHLLQPTATAPVSDQIISRKIAYNMSKVLYTFISGFWRIVSIKTLGYSLDNYLYMLECCDSDEICWVN